MLGSFNNWNIIKFPHKITTSESFEDIIQIIVDGISENNSLLVKYIQHGVIYKTDTKKIGNYVIKFVSEAYTLQYYTTCEGRISSDGELVAKTQYLSCMKLNKDIIEIRNSNNKLSLFQHSLLYIHVLMLCQ